MSVSVAFTDEGPGLVLTVPPGQSLTYAVTGTWVQTLQLQRRVKGGWETVVETTINASGSVENRTVKDQEYRWSCSADTSGTSTCVIAPVASELVGLDDIRNPDTNELLLRFRDDGVEIPNLVGAHANAAVSAMASATRSDGVGTKNGALVSVVEKGVGMIHQTVLTMAALVMTLTDDGGVGQFGGLKLYDFPAGNIKILGAVIDADLTLVDTEWIDTIPGDVSLGSVVVDDADALDGLFVDILASTAIAALAAQVGPIDAQSLADVVPFANAGATDLDLFLNMRIDDNAAHITGTGTITGTVTVTWMNLGDIG